eukprot:UN20355
MCLSNQRENSVVPYTSFTVVSECYFESPFLIPILSPRFLALSHFNIKSPLFLPFVKMWNSCRSSPP